MFSHYILMDCMFPSFYQIFLPEKNMRGSHITGLQIRAVTFYFISDSDIFPVHLVIYMRL